MLWPRINCPCLQAVPSVAESRPASYRNQTHGHVRCWTKERRAEGPRHAHLCDQYFCLFSFIAGSPLGEKNGNTLSLAGTLNAVPVSMNKKGLATESLFKRSRTSRSFLDP